MAKVQPSDLFTSISGKLCSKEGTYIALNKQTGKMYSAVRHVNTYSNTEAQQEVRNAFVSRSKLGTAWWKANKPSEENPKGTDNYQLVMKAYKSQHKIGNPLNYLRSLVTEDLKVKLGDLDITGEIKVDAPSSGAGSKPGGTQTPSGGSTGGNPSGSQTTGGSTGGNPSGSQTTGGGSSQGAGGDDGKAEG